MVRLFAAAWLAVLLMAGGASAATVPFYLHLEAGDEFRAEFDLTGAQPPGLNFNTVFTFGGAQEFQLELIDLPTSTTAYSGIFTGGGSISFGGPSLTLVGLVITQISGEQRATIEAKADARLPYNVTRNGLPIVSAVPLPPGILLIGSAILLLAFRARRSTRPQATSPSA